MSKNEKNRITTNDSCFYFNTKKVKKQLHEIDADIAISSIKSKTSHILTLILDFDKWHAQSESGPGIQGIRASIDIRGSQCGQGIQGIQGIRGNPGNESRHLTYANRGIIYTIKDLKKANQDVVNSIGIEQYRKYILRLFVLLDGFVNVIDNRMKTMIDANTYEEKELNNDMEKMYREYQGLNSTMFYVT